MTQESHSLRNPSISHAEWRVALIASLTLATGLSAFADRGGGKGKPGGGEDPPPPPPPFYYQITKHTAKLADDRLYLYDVSPDETVVGASIPGGVFFDSIAIMRFKDGFEIDLEELLIGRGDIPADWRVTRAPEICDGLLVGVRISGSPDPEDNDTRRGYCGALKFNADRTPPTLDWFALFEDPNGEDAFLQDATENGEFLIATGEINVSTATLEYSRAATLSLWNPTTGTTRVLPEPVEGGRGGWYFSSVSDYLGGTALAVDSLYDFITPEMIPLPPAANPVSTLDIGADGTVLVAIEGRAGTHPRKDPGEPDVLARWVPGTETWETIMPTSAATVYGHHYAHPMVNSSGEIAGTNLGVAFVFHDSYDLHLVDDMIDPSQASEWDSGAPLSVYGYSDPIPEPPYSGVILGYDENDGWFTLTPVPIEP